MRSLKAIMAEENRAWNEVCALDNRIRSCEQQLADIRANPIECPAKERDLEDCLRAERDYLCEREAAVEILNHKRDELRGYFAELMKGE